jgi:hypothetical protein
MDTDVATVKASKATLNVNMLIHSDSDVCARDQSPDIKMNLA